MSLDVNAGGYFNSGIAYGSHQYLQLRDVANESERLLKSYQTGEGIVPAGDQTSGKPLRVQFLHGVLETVSFAQDDAGAMKRIPKEKVYSNTFEWTQFNAYGSAGDGFTAESGFDSASTGTGAGNLFGINAADDTFTRLVRQVKFMAAVRNISLVIQNVKNVADPEKTATEAMTRELIAKANLAIYWGDSKKAVNQYDGIVRQLLDWLTPNSQGAFAGYPAETSIIYDAAGAPMDKYLLEDICLQTALKYGSPSLLIQSVIGLGDTQKALFPEARYNEGQTTGVFGNNRRKFVSTFGEVDLQHDIMLRPNQPLTADGPGVLGMPRATADTGATTWAANPFVAPSGGNGCQVLAAGAGYFWNNVNLNTDNAILGTVPALPSGDGNQGNRTPAGSYYYAVSVVVGGKESLPWVYGAASANAFASATALSPTSGSPVVQIDIDPTQITGLGTSFNRNQVKIRVYRTITSLAAAPTAFSTSTWGLLCEAGCPSSGNIRIFDNGMYIPGADNAFLITEKKNGSKGWFFAQLLPLMKRTGLPEYIMGSPLAMLLFGAPILLVPRHHIWVRNIGRLQ